MQVLGMQSPPTTPQGHFDPARHPQRKRKADVQDSERERLSKRLSLLRLAEQSQSNCQDSPPADADPTSTSQTNLDLDLNRSPAADDSMQLDDSKHRIYIHSLDDELSSDSDGEDASGKLVFPPHIRRHLLQNRIPRQILANDEGEIAGMQIVLYNEPKALSVPEEQDGVRRAVTEARERLRERQRMDRQAVERPVDMNHGDGDGDGDGDDDMMDID